MLRKSAAILALFLASFAPQVFALGLGAVTVESALNQPLRVRIEVLQLGDTRLDDVNIQVASPEDFIRFGIERAVFLNNIRFRTESTANGNFVVLTTNQIVREPYLSFILETRWSNGRLLSEHTILLDLPVFQDRATAPQTPVRAPISTTLTPPANSNTPNTPRQQSQSEPAASGQSSQPILEPEVISAPTAVNEAVEQATPAPIEEQPAAQPAPLAQTQEEGAAAEVVEAEIVETEVVEAEVAPSEPEEVVVEDVVEEVAEATVEETIPAPEVEQTITSSDSETLTDIALRVRPNQSVSVQQTMLAIQELNPDAFIGGNINRLRSGQVLTVPSLADIQAIDQRQAIDEVSRQNRQIAQAADVQPLAAPANTVPTQEPATGQLSVISGDPDSQEPGSGADSSDLDRRIVELETQLALREEEADRARLERQEMESRLADLNEQIAAAQEIIRLQDLQLAQLQQAFADAAAEAELAAQQAAAAAAQIEVPATQIRQPSLLDALLGNAMLLIAGAGVLVLGLVMFLIRRNKASADSADEELVEIDDKDFSGVTDKQENNSDKEKSGGEFQDYNDADLDSELDDIISVGSKSENKAPATDPDMVFDTNNIEDICAQADTLIEQDNIKQAENLVRAAIEDNPDNEQLSLKLLAVLAAKGDVSAFEMLADELHDLQDPEIDEEVNALRSGLSIQEPESKSFIGKADTSAQKEKDDTASFLDDLGIDLDSFEDDTFELADDDAKPVNKPASKPTIPVADLPDDPEPEGIDFTFDFADDPADEATEKLEADDSKGEEIANENAHSDDDANIDTFDFDAEDEHTPVLASGASKNADDLEIDSLDFDSPAAPVESAEPSSEEDKLEFETFSFDAPALEGVDKKNEEAPEIEAADDNALDFSFDKSELESTPAESAAEEEIETFDFDLSTPSADTIVEKSENDEISFDLDEEVESEAPAEIANSDDATVVETQASSKDFDFDLSDLEVDGDEVDEDIEISLSDDDFLDLGDDEEPVEISTEPDDEDDLIEFDFDDELPASKPVTKAVDEAVDDDDLNFLTDDDDEIDVSSISIDDDDDDSYAMSDEDETATKLELAYAYQKMGDAEGAKEILLEVIREGTENQVKEAGELMKSIENSND